MKDDATQTTEERSPDMTKAVELAKKLVSNFERMRGGADYGMEQKNERYEITVARALLTLVGKLSQEELAVSWKSGRVGRKARLHLPSAATVALGKEGIEI